MVYSCSIRKNHLTTYSKGPTVAAQNFKTAEEFMLAQKYNRLHRKGRLLQKLVREGWIFVITGPGLFVLEKEYSGETMSYSVWGSVFSPKTHKEVKVGTKPLG